MHVASISDRSRVGASSEMLTFEGPWPTSRHPVFPRPIWVLMSSNRVAQVATAILDAGGAEIVIDLPQP